MHSTSIELQPSTDPVAQSLSVRVGTRDIPYFLRAADTPNRPILVILHGHGYASAPAQFRNPNWNVICPMDQFGVQSFGSWFLGEDGDFFWIEAMQRILADVRQQVGNGKLYFWGSSMGGYGALLHGYLNHATAVYANTPQTQLLGSTYAQAAMGKYFAPVFGDRNVPEYNDLKILFKSRSRTQYFLCFNQLEPANYFAEQGLPFITHLHSFKQKFYLEVRPLDKHGKNHRISETITLFKTYGV